jgi:aminopeptidase N
MSARSYVSVIIFCLLTLFDRAPVQAAAGDGRIPFGAGRAYVHYPRFHSYQLDDVKIRVSLDETHGSIVGDVVNSVTILEDNALWVDLDAAGLDFKWVGLADGRALRYQTFGQTLRVFLPVPARIGARFRIETRYSASPKIGMYFFTPDAAYPHRPLEIWTAGEPDSSRYWFPTYDWPDEKATTETITTVPIGQTVVSNGRLLGVVNDRAHHTATITWREGIPHSTYLTAIYAGYFDRVAASAGDVPISYYAARGLGPIVADNYRVTPDAMSFFERENGVRYPWEKYAEVQIQSDAFGSLENVSATMLGGTPHDRRSELDGHLGAGIAHELSHQWWGDDETCADWGHLWLNEGYATYYEALFRQHLYGDDAFAMDIHEIAASALDQDSQYRRPIVTERYASPMEMFDGTTYDKGAVVLHMLHVMLGDDLYRKGQTAFLTEYAQKPATTAQWESAFERATGRDLSQFTKEWLYQAGYPEYDVRWHFDGATGNTLVHVDQTQSGAWDTPTVFSMPIPIELLYPDGSRQQRTVTVNARTQDFSLPYYEMFSVPEGQPVPTPAELIARARPQTLIFDSGGSVFAWVDDHAKTEELQFRMTHASSLVDRLDAFEEMPQTPATLPWLTEFLKTERDPDERAEALGQLKLTVPGVRALYLRYLASGPPAVRAAAASGLGTAHADAATIAALERHAEYDQSYATMAAAISALGRLRASSARTLLFAALKDESANGRIAGAALGAIGRLEGRAAISLLERYARYGAPADSRPAAISALARAGRGAAPVASFVEGLLGDRDLAVKYEAAGALGDIGVAAAIPALDHQLTAVPDLPFYRDVVRGSISQLQAEARRGSTKRRP